MKRKLFCEISPLTYQLSSYKCQLIRHIQNLLSKETFSSKQANQVLPILVFEHKSLIRRKLGNVDGTLQNNKAINLVIAAPRIHQIVIQPGETFSFWHLVGSTTKKKGYLEGLTISQGKVCSGTGGGMCQFSNLLHWMILHSPLTITEHHHHNEFDLFPDSGRQVPFGTGTSILYPYLDYRFKNNTSQPFQLMTFIEDGYLIGQLRSHEPIDFQYDVFAKEEYFYQNAGMAYRYNQVVRNTNNKATGDFLDQEELLQNNAKVMYDTSYIADHQWKQDKERQTTFS